MILSNYMERVEKLQSDIILMVNHEIVLLVLK